MIYFAQDSGSLDIKIGHTDRPVDDRIAQLQTGNPSPIVLLAVTPGDQRTERRLHQQFHAAIARPNGEWFRPVPALLQLIADSRVPAPASAINPEMALVARLEAGEPVTIFLAGSMFAPYWRNTIVEGMWPVGWASRCQVQPSCILGKHHYAGPFDVTDGDDVPTLCRKQIANCDVLFVWIERRTERPNVAAEIGLARGMNKVVWLAGPEPYHGDWFLHGMTHRRIFGREPARNLERLLCLL